jgi:ParB-like chromosome segregation protein Spo0J
VKNKSKQSPSNKEGLFFYFLELVFFHQIRFNIVRDLINCGVFRMSISTLQSNVNRAHKDIADIQKKISQLKVKETQNLSKINQINRSITKNTSVSLLSSKMRQIESLQKDIAKISSDYADLSKKLASKTSDLNNYSLRLTKEEEKERKKILDAEKRREREQLEHQRKITQELETQKQLTQQLLQEKSLEENQEDVTYDLFISHASEDKDEFVRPLADELTRIGVKVWYDEFTLKVGDSLRRSIDKGLSNARFGVVVLSSSFIQKNWTQYELDGLVAREMEGVKVILPIWHKITKSELIKYSPTLADKVALNSSLLSVEEIANQLADVAIG